MVKRDGNDQAELMSGHSKWSTIKRHKAAIDAKRGKAFSLIGKELTLAARQGGGNPDFNPQLRMCVQKARAANMPGDNIQKAIQKGTGELPSETIEELIYEGYGPGGVAIIVEVTTDNKNRTASEVRSVFTKLDGSLAGSGSLAFVFRRKGQFLIARDAVVENELLSIALDGGAEDVRTHDDHFDVQCDIGDYYVLSKLLEERGVRVESAELVYLPNTSVPVDDLETARKILRMIDRLDDLEDVKNVFANYEMSPEVLREAQNDLFARRAVT
jgi:YebC/PmpR family DNA-binding regulatory protein